MQIESSTKYKTQLKSVLTDRILNFASWNKLTNFDSDSVVSDSEGSRTMRVNRGQLYTESIGCTIASDSASPKSSQSQIHANQHVFQPHYPDSLVNYTFIPLTAHLDIRITTRIGIYPKNPCQLSSRTIDLSFGIQNQYESVVTYPKELSTYPFASLTAISDSESLTFVSVAKKSHTLTPYSGNMEPPTVEIWNPLQWKYVFDTYIKSCILGVIKESKMSNEPKQRSEEFLNAIREKFAYDRDKGAIFTKKTGVYQEGLISYKYKGCNVKINGRSYTIRVHHVVWLFEYGEWPDKEVDHIDGNKLNNHYTNLRLCERRENMIYYHQKQETSSNYIGVYYHKNKNIWRAAMRVNGKKKHIKESKSEEVCARAYDDYRIKLGLDPINFPMCGDSNK